MAEEKFDLMWNDFGRYAERTIRNLVDDSQFTDVTLISDDKKKNQSSQSYSLLIQ